LPEHILSTMLLTRRESSKLVTKNSLEHVLTSSARTFPQRLHCLGEKMLGVEQLKLMPIQLERI